MNTYPWIMATAISRQIKTFKINEFLIKIIKFLLSVLLSKEIKIWPAIILADSRIARVSGRMMFLIVSIKTINGHKNKGVFEGTKCVNILLEVITHPVIINLIQKGRDKNKEKDMCLVGVNTKGINLIRLDI